MSINLNKKGEITLEEVVKLVLAVIGISILLLLAFNLYKILTTKTEAEQAKIHLGRIEKVLKDISPGETIEYILTGPRGWYLVGYESSKISSGGGKYNSTVYCENKDCICLCNMKGKEVKSFTITTGGGVSSNTAFVDYFYQQKIQGYGTPENTGYLSCEAESVCFKMDGVKIRSSEGTYPEPLPWIDLNNSVVSIKISGQEGGPIISRK